MQRVTHSFAQLAKSKRKTLGLTQLQLAQKMNCSLSLVRKIESGERLPTRQIAGLMAQALCKTNAEREAFIKMAAATGEMVVAPNPVPSPLTALLGRETDMAALRELIANGEARLITLSGMGGVGKTRLALALAADGILGAPDEVIFVNLAPVQNPQLLMLVIAQAMGLRESDTHTAMELARNRLRQKPAWVILDNMEQLLPEAAITVAQILSQCPQAKALVTSREVLNVRGERVYVVPPLASEPSISLFAERAKTAAPGWRFTSASQNAIGEICARLDGLPLAIELAAARMKTLSPRQIQAELSAGRAMNLLKAAIHDMPDRHHALRDTIEWSCRQLSDSQRQLFGLLAVFSGGWTLESAQAARGACCPREDAIADDMASLLDKNLILRVSPPDVEPPRFDMLATIREFGREWLARLHLDQQARGAHAAHFLALAQTAQPHLRGSHQLDWVEKLEAEHDNLRAALGWFIEQRETRAALLFAQAMWMFWYIRGYYTEGRKRLDAALALPRMDGDDEARGQALYGAGALSQLQGDMGVAAEYALQSIEVWQKLGDARGLGQANTVLGNVAYGQGRMDDALKRHTAALNAFEHIHDDRNSAIALNNLGQIYENAGALDEAHACFEKALALARKLEDTRVIATLLGNLGVVLRRQGNKKNAVSFHEEALALRIHLGDPRGVANTLGNLGDSRLEAGQNPRNEYTESLRFFQNLGDKVGLIRALERVAHIAALDGNAALAATLCLSTNDAVKAYGLKRVTEDEQRVQGIMRIIGDTIAGETLTLEQASRLAMTPASQ